MPISRSNQILKALVTRLIKKLQSQYQQEFCTNLPIILVTGTLGKSSMTLILNQYFESLGYQVYSGTSLNRNLNSLAGLGMILSDTDFNLEGGKILAKAVALAKLSSNLIKKIALKNFDLPEKTILIYELGYDHQNESQIFQDIFDRVDVLVCTNLGWEHNEGFEKEFNKQRLENYLGAIPLDLLEKFSGSEIDSRLKNIAFEQLTLSNRADYVITPIEIGKITNQIACQNNQTQSEETLQTIAKRGHNFELISDNLSFNPNYFLPDTFAKNSLILEQVTKKLNVYDPEKINQILHNVKLPFSRFGKFKGVQNSTIIDSTYNSDPNSLKEFLHNIELVFNFYKDAENREKADLVEQPKHFVIIGEMRELGDMAPQLHEEVLKNLADLKKNNQHLIEEIILIGSEWKKLNQNSTRAYENCHQIIKNQSQSWKVFEKAGHINRYLEDKIRPNSWFWIKGSQNTIFLEIVVEHLLKEKADSARLCRRGPAWDKLRKPYLE